ncbi:hypothetical protein DFS33DRAFT_1271307 [Desarmillaria ectypa]|nr:hypothetical protein DFS33DRAFT_1271307 [Desarmillaria ectypa]
MASSIADLLGPRPAPAHESFLDKATKVFHLYSPVPSTPVRWRVYARNRAAADKIRLRDRKSEKSGYESLESDSDEWDIPNDYILFFLPFICRTMPELEGKLQLPAQSLKKGCEVLWCNAAPGEPYNHRLQDLYAHSKHSGQNSSRRFGSEETQIKCRWRSLEHAYQERLAQHFLGKVIVSPLSEAQAKRQEELIRTVRVVSAAMEWTTTAKDDIPDMSPGELESIYERKLGQMSWMAHGNTNKWSDREAIQACGFQLPRDAKEKEEAEKEKKEIPEEEPEEECSDDDFGPLGLGECNPQ